MISLVCYRTQGGVRPAFVVEPSRANQKYLKVLMMGGAGPLKVQRVSKEERRHMSELQRKERLYPPKRAARIFGHYGRTFGITTSARRMLAEVNKQ